MATKKTIADILDARGSMAKAGRWFNVAMLILITANIVALMLETVASIRATAGEFFPWFERMSVAIFTVEYVARLWSCTELEDVEPSWRGRLGFFLTPMMLVDLIAIAPFYLPMAGVDLRSARALRLFRLFRIVKMGRYSRTLQAFGRVVRAKSAELVVLVFILVVTVVIAASVVYFAEHDAQPEKFSSIPQSAWWAITTLTTVGYGDAYPVTDLGRVLAAVIEILGIGVIALPTGVLGAAFVEEVRQGKREALCPHCGKEIVGTDLDGLGLES